MKNVLITGSSRGIGRATALLLTKKGYNVIVNYNSNKQKAEELLEEIKKINPYAIAVRADVSDCEQVISMFSEIKEKFGGIDILVNNAGIAEQKMFNDITEKDWDRMFDVNVKGAYNCIKCSMDHMIHQKWGRIVNLSSIWGITGASCEVHYSASKAAVIGLTKALAKELGPSGITVNCVAPGVIDTDMNHNLTEEIIEELKEETPVGEIGSAQDIAEAISFFVSDSSKFITGQILSPNGGFVV